jgi:hypothetical protein
MWRVLWYEVQIGFAQSWFLQPEALFFMIVG